MATGLNSWMAQVGNSWVAAHENYLRVTAWNVSLSLILMEMVRCVYLWLAWQHFLSQAVTQICSSLPVQAVHWLRNVTHLVLRQEQIHTDIEYRPLVLAIITTKKDLVDCAIHIIGADIPVFISPLPPFAFKQASVCATNRISRHGSR